MRKLAFKSRWTKTKKLKTTSDGSYKVFKKWQKECYGMIHAESWRIINAATGSGKTLEIMGLVMYDLNKDPNKIAVIVVPQVNIANGFREEKFKVGKEKHHWFTNHVLCGIDGSTIDEFIRIIDNQRDTNYEDRIIVCTHMTLIHVRKKLAKQKKLKILRRISLYIDEAHHVMSGENASNGLGSVVNYFLKNKLPITMITATFFRGDKINVIPKKYKDQFKKFSLPFDKYIEYTSIKSFQFDFVAYSKDYIDAFVGLYKKDHKKKTILYIPSTNSGCSTGNKHKEVRRILKEISDDGSYEEEGGVITLVCNGEIVKVVNLVKEHNRGVRQVAIFNSKATANVDLIIAMKTFQEGSDYPPLERVIVAGPRGSIGTIAQCVGRAFRDYMKKHHVEFIQLFPFNKKEVRDSLNSYLNLIMASLLLEDIIDPIPAPLFNKNGKRMRGKNISHLASVFPGGSDRLAFIDDVWKKAIKSGNMTFDRITKIIVKSKELSKIKLEDRKLVAIQVWMMMVRRTIKKSKLSKLDFESIKQVDVSGSFMTYTSGLCNVKTFEELRKAIYGDLFLSFEDAKKKCMEMKITGYKDYKKRRTSDLPSHPDASYEEWIDWYDFLGNKKKIYLSYEEAKKKCREMKFKGGDDYKKRRTNDLPSCPYIYHKEWIDWYDFLGKDKPKFLPFEEAKKKCREMKLKSGDDYNKRRTSDLPGGPNRFYKEWINWYDFLGNKKKIYLSYEEAKKKCREMKFKNVKDYNKRRTSDLPSCPYIYYKEWIDWYDFFGNKRRSLDIISFEEAKKKCREMRYTNRNDYKKRKTSDLPSNPDQFYKEWINWYDYLGKDAA